MVLDIGQFSSKTGFAGEDNPSSIFFTIVGTPKYNQIEGQYSGKVQQELYVGEEIQSLGLYKLFYPIKKGKIIDWNHFEKILDYTFYTLRVDPTLFNILYCTHPLFPKDDLERLFEIFLEKYQCMAFYPVIDSLCTLYSGGFQTGLVIEIGDSSTRVIPIYEGYILDHAIKVLNMGGKTLTNYMEKVIQDSTGFNVDSSLRRELIRALKERACFVSLDYKQDLKRANEYRKQYSMPDGSTLTLDKERFMIPELIFNPKQEFEETPLPKIVLDVIDACDIDIRPNLLNNIFLSGGSSMFPNFKSRMYQELELELARRKKSDQIIRIIAPRERTFSVWIGGSILATIPEFSENWITRAKYFKDGIPLDDLLL
ncbi:MAG: actin family protein [Candidatus Lokiarchaeota archaeon]